MLGIDRAIAAAPVLTVVVAGVTALLCIVAVCWVLDLFFDAAEREDEPPEKPVGFWPRVRDRAVRPGDLSTRRDPRR